MEGKKITSVFEIGNSYSLLGFDDGTAALVKVVNPELSVEEVEEMVTPFVTVAKPDKKKAENIPAKKKPEPEEPDPEEETYNWGDLSEMSFKELTKFCDENELDVDPDDFEKSEEVELREAIAKELEIDIPKGIAKLKDEEVKDDDEETRDDDSYSWRDLEKFDYEELTELCEQEDLEVDPSDFEEEEEVQLRRAIAKELKIEVPKKKKD